MENENKKSKKALIAIIAVLIVAVIILVGWFLRPISSKDLFICQIKDVMNASKNSNESKLNTTVSLSGNIETTDEEIKSIAQIINDAKIILNVQADEQLGKYLVGANVDYQNESLINLKEVFQKDDDYVYIYVQDLFDKYFKVNIDEIEGEESLTNLKIEDSEKVTEIVCDEIISNLKDEYFSKEKVDDMTKNNLKLTVQQVNDIAKNIALNLKENEEFLNCFENKEKIKEDIDEILNSSNEVSEEYKDAYIDVNIYTKGLRNKIVKFDIGFVASENESAKLTVIEKDENNADFTLEVKDEENEIPYTAEALKGTITKEELTDGTVKTVIVIDNVPEVGKVTLNMEIKNSNVTDLESIDTSNSVEFDKMTEEDAVTMYRNLQNMKIYKMFGQMLQSLDIF